MFDAEKLLGKVLSGVSPSFSSKKKKYKKKNKQKKYKQKHRSDDLVSGLASKLMSGKGLMTAVGLGVGAYTILKSNQSSNQQQVPSASQPIGISAQPQSSPPPPPPPPSPGSSSAVVSPVQPDIPASVQSEEILDDTVSASAAEQFDAQNLALRMIQVMIAAAHADGDFDAEEEREIINRLREANLDNEEKGYILSQFHSPKSIEELTVGINDPQVCQAMYSLAVSSIVIDTDIERQWLDKLAQALGLSADMQAFIEE